MPLPELVVGVDQPYSASFEDVSSVASSGLQGLNRLACLGDHGIALLQQRFVYYLTRFVVPTDKLHQVCAPVLAESELQEEWVGRATARGTSSEEAEAEFHEFIRAPREGGGSLQASLDVASKHGFVFKETRGELNRRYGPDAPSGG
jgi:hypothetical protein